MTVLRIDASIQGDRSASSALADLVLDELVAAVPGTPGFVLSHQAESPEAVDDILDRVLAGGGSVITPGTQSEWGYSAYFADTEGNVWELMAQPVTN